MNIQGKAALITGASQGLGRALAMALAERGARVALVARNRGRLEDTVQAIRARGGEAYGIAADVGDKHAIHRIAGQASALVGAIDILVHNASTLGPTPLRWLFDTECEDFAHVLEVNLLGPFRLTKALAGSMVLRGAGLILHISSDAALEAYPQWGAYGVSKAALDHLSRAWAKELEGTGVEVLSLDPGEMDTDMHRAALPDADPSTLASPAKVAEHIADHIVRAAGTQHGARLIALPLPA